MRGSDGSCRRFLRRLWSATAVGLCGAPQHATGRRLGGERGEVGGVGHSPSKSASPSAPEIDSLNDKLEVERKAFVSFLFSRTTTRVDAIANRPTERSPSIRLQRFVESCQRAQPRDYLPHVQYNSIISYLLPL